MARNKKGLGTLADDGDLLGKVFGDGGESRANAAPPKGKGEKEETAKYFKLDKELIKRLKIFCITRDLSEKDVVTAALTSFLEKEGA